MLPNANCLFVAVLVVAATATRIAVDSKLEQSKLEHPQLDLPSSAQAWTAFCFLQTREVSCSGKPPGKPSPQVAGRVTTDGLVKWSSTGAVSYKKAKLLYVTAVSDHNIHFQEKPKSGALHRHTTFVGWNNLLTGTVTRYLFVTDYDEKREILSWCKTSTEPRDKGYIDPFVEVEEKFRTWTLVFQAFYCLCVLVSYLGYVGMIAASKVEPPRIGICVGTSLVMENAQKAHLIRDPAAGRYVYRGGW